MFTNIKFKQWKCFREWSPFRLQNDPILKTCPLCLNLSFVNWCQFCTTCFDANPLLFVFWLVFSRLNFSCEFCGWEQDDKLGPILKPFPLSGFVFRKLVTVAHKPYFLRIHCICSLGFSRLKIMQQFCGEGEGWQKVEIPDTWSWFGLVQNFHSLPFAVLERYCFPTRKKQIHKFMLQ